MEEVEGIPESPCADAQGHSHEPRRSDGPPAPRLQFRWIPYEGGEPGFGFNWQAVYELVLPLRGSDIRRDIYEDGDVVGQRSELRIELSRTNVGRGNRIPCDGPEPQRDTPFRDGVHAIWDREALGGWPVFVIAPDGRAFSVPDQSADAIGDAALSVPEEP